MLKNYFKVALRNLWKSKGYSAMNIVGLAAGLGVCLLIVLYVVDELSYDRPVVGIAYVDRLFYCGGCGEVPRACFRDDQWKKKNAEIADAMATPVMIMGIKAGLDMINQMQHIEAILIDDD